MNSNGNTKAKVKAINDGLWQYFTLTILFSWFMWLPGVLSPRNLIAPHQFPVSVQNAMQWIAGIGPSLVALFLTFKRQGKKGTKKLLGRALRFRLGYWYIPLFLIIPVTLVVSHWLNVILFGATFPKTGLLNEPWWIPIVFLIFCILQVSEEFGWRGYALERLQTRWNATVSSIALGTIWAIWHLPMFFSQGLGHHDKHLPFGQFLATLVLVSLFITWLQNNTNGSLLPAFALHAMVNLSGEVLPLIEKSEEIQGDYTSWIIANVLFLVLAIIVLVVWGPKTLTRNKNNKLD